MARQVIDSPVADEQRLRMSYEEYLDWSTEDTRAEWVDGEVIIFMSVTRQHQLLVGFLYELLSLFARLVKPGEVLLGAAQMRLPDQRSAREPDVFFLAAEHFHRRTRLGIEGPADLVIEIVSDDSVRRDQIEKRDEYAAAGVPEYRWLDPRPGQHQASFYRLTRAGRYEMVPLDAAGRFLSEALPGLWLDPTWLWQNPLPDPLALMKRIAPEALRAFLLAPDAG